MTTNGTPSDVEIASIELGGATMPLDWYIAQIYQRALAAHGWNVSQTATALDVGRATLYRAIKAYKLVPPEMSLRHLRLALNRTGHVAELRTNDTDPNLLVIDLLLYEFEGPSDDWYRELVSRHLPDRLVSVSIGRMPRPS